MDPQLFTIVRPLNTEQKVITDYKWTEAKPLSLTVLGEDCSPRETPPLLFLLSEKSYKNITLGLLSIITGKCDTISHKQPSILHFFIYEVP